MLRWLTDENIPRPIIRFLREQGHDVKDARESGLEGAQDYLLIELARKEQRILITTDKGFSNIIAYTPGTHAGIVVLRMKKPTGKGLTALFRKFIETYDLSLVSGSLIIIGEKKIRRRNP